MSPQNGCCNLVEGATLAKKEKKEATQAKKKRKKEPPWQASMHANTGVTLKLPPLLLLETETGHISYSLCSLKPSDKLYDKQKASPLFSLSDNTMAGCSIELWHYAPQKKEK